MRIKSNFHDYYDSLQANDQDRTLIYLRKAVESKIAGPFPFPIFTNGRNWGRWAWSRNNAFPCFRQFIVGFCGKIYPVVQLSISEEITANCHNIADVDHFMKENYKEKVFRKYFYSTKLSFLEKFWGENLSRVHLEKWFNDVKIEQDKFLDIFMKNKCPIFIVSEGPLNHEDDRSITINGCLKDLEFFRVIDPFTAFQEIDMFLANIAIPNHPIPKVSDKDMAEAKGYDKWSFRKEPKQY